MTIPTGGLPYDSLIQILNSTEMGIAVFDKDLSLTFANKPLHDIYRLPVGTFKVGTPLAVLGKSVVDRVAGEDPSKVMAEMVEQAENPDGQWRSRASKDGRHFRHCYIRLADGALTYLLQDVSELKVFEQLHKEKSEQLETIIEGMADGINILDSDNRLVLANRGYMEAYGLPDHLRVPGTHISEFSRWLLSESGGLTEHEMAEALNERVASIVDATKNENIYEVQNTLDGRTLEIRRHRTATGFLISTYIDISERLVAREELRKSEERYKAIVEDQTDMISRLDVDLNVTFANMAYRRAFLKDPSSEDIIGRNILDGFATEEARFEFKRKVQSLTVENPIHKSEILERVADGTLRWQSWQERALYDEDETLLGYQSVGRDITEQKIAEEALAANLKERELIVDGALDAIVTTDENGRVREFNRAAEVMFGYQADEIIGQSGRILIAPEYRATYDHALERHKAGEEIVSAEGKRDEIEVVKSDGTNFSVERGFIHASNDKQKLFVAFMRDMTEPKRIAAQLEQQRKMVAQSEKMSAIGSLLANVAHELNNPLSVVIGQADLLKELAGDEKTKLRGERIKAAADRCAKIVRTFLSMARQKPTESEAFPVDRPIKEAVQLLDYGLKTSGIDLVIEREGHLPDLFGDATQVGQIVSNLLVNAQQILVEHPAPRKIVCQANMSPTDGNVVILISDNGPGVPIDQAARIFEPFFTTKEEGSGTGIGLAIAHNIAQAHGGSLRLLESSTLGGATFELRLPAHFGDNKAPPDMASIADNSKSAKTKILIVDDELPVAETAAEQLMIAGYVCSVADGAGSALSLMEREEFDVILSDVQMPDMAGPAFMERAEQKWPGISARFGFFTGDSLSASANKFFATSQVQFIEKPFARADLLELIGKLEVNRPRG